MVAQFCHRLVKDGRLLPDDRGCVVDTWTRKGWSTMGVHKQELRQVATEGTDAWESVGYPTHLFNKLIIPFEQGWGSMI